MYYVLAVFKIALNFYQVVSSWLNKYADLYLKTRVRRPWFETIVSLYD